MADYGRHSETERGSIDNDRLVTLNQCKIQSGLTRNAKDSKTKPYNADFDGDKLNLNV